MAKNYFPHDSDSRNDFKIKQITSKWGLRGYAWWWITLEILRELPNISIKIDTNLPTLMQFIAAELHTTENKANTFINDLISIGLLVKTEEEIYSASLRIRLKNLQSLSSIRKEMGKKGANARWDKEREEREGTWNTL